MELRLFQNTSDRKTIGKSIALVATINDFHWKEDTNILHPSITFHKFQEWKNFNYAQIIWKGTPGRYYFIDNIKVCKGQIIEIQLSEDVRETWKGWIQGQRYLVSRQEYIHNKIISDERKVVPLTRQVSAKTYSTAVGDGGDGTIILTVSG